jgi:MraZ protein
MLIGQYATTVTGGNRVAIPKKFRAKLGKNFIVAKWYESCLVLVATNSWEALLERITGTKSTVTVPVRRTDRFILGSAFELAPDNQGRAVLLKTLVAFAGLKDEIVFVGLGDRVEIWDKQRWEEEESKVARSASELLESINGNE